MYKGTPIRPSADFSAETAGQKRVTWYIQSDERITLQPRIFYPSRLSFIFEGEIRSFRQEKTKREAESR